MGVLEQGQQCNGSNVADRGPPVSSAGHWKLSFGSPLSHWCGRLNGRLSDERAARVAAQRFGDQSRP